MFYCIIPLSSEDSASDGHGGTLLSRKDKVGIFYSDLNTANRAAQRLAEEQPRHQFGLMKLECVYETTSPKIIKKVINNLGELILEKT